MTDELIGKVALVTGAGRGIGRAIALALAGAGADVAVNYVENKKEADAVCVKIRELGRRAEPVKADVGKAADVEAMLRTAAEKLGEISILVNNAGIAKPKGIDDVNENIWDETIRVNLKSCFLLIQAVLPAMRARKWGRIINISSVAAQVGGIIGPHYAASKAGILGLTHYYASQLAGEGITCNSISPALIATAMIADNPKARPDMIPVGRFGTADEVAGAAVLLARNAYITGQNIMVNGGLYFT
jgi:3-oxoacyl-[acyl-carrier protein] reductase